MAANCARRKRDPASSRECGCGTARLSWRSSAEWAASRVPAPTHHTGMLCPSASRKFSVLMETSSALQMTRVRLFGAGKSETITLPMTMASPAQVFMRPFKAFKTYRCHTQSASVLSKTSTPTVLSAEPLCSYAQMTSAKLVIELPSTENVCVDHRRRNGPNTVRAGLSQSFGENLNAENFFWNF